MTEGSGPVPYAAAARSLLRDTVIDAVDGLARARGWSATTMTDVARAAGVSRRRARAAPRSHFSESAGLEGPRSRVARGRGGGEGGRVAVAGPATARAAHFAHVGPVSQIPGS